ncbi:hypothetical protein Barb6_03643 [Bacteroidales bacterium Barb6]|nr:hypothetical protein Barb6_03643 [Bacteroidales bacterium Barb6]OAV73756.1 hypothetical protein Barb7_02875 [Bacteroidales bacterium Barb7]
MNKNRKYRTNLLLPSASFLAGTGSVFNIAGNYFNFKHTNKETDAKAILSDWGVIGEDFQEVIFWEKIK